MLPGTGLLTPAAAGEADGVGEEDAELEPAGEGVGDGVACKSAWRRGWRRPLLFFGDAALLVAPGFGEAGDEALGAGAGVPLATARTCRNCSSAVSSSAAS